MEDKLKTIAENTERKQDYSIVLSSNLTDFTTNLYPPLQLKADKWSVLID